jgi:hypothetical protein
MVTDGETELCGKVSYIKISRRRATEIESCRWEDNTKLNPGEIGYEEITGLHWFQVGSSCGFLLWISQLDKVTAMKSSG